jgi:hypothetical protein
VHPDAWPKRLYNLLAVEGVPRGQSEQLDEAPGFPQAPPILFDELRANPKAKAAKQPDAHLLRLAPDSPSSSRATAVLVVVLGGWLALRMATHPLSLYLCFMRNTGCRLLLQCGG